MGASCCSNIDPNKNDDGTIVYIFVQEILLSNQDANSRNKITFKPQKNKLQKQGETLIECQRQDSIMAVSTFLKQNDYNAETNLEKELFVKIKKGRLVDHYEMGEELGKGAYGQVLRVTHKTTKIERALKTIAKSSIKKEDEENLFSEMQILKNLDHPNILKLIEFFQDEKNYYLITEICSGGELFDRIKQLNFFSERMAADIMQQVLSAIMYCHKHKIAHRQQLYIKNKIERDLKPENILFISHNDQSQIKIIDFGTSRQFDSTKRMKKRLGTPYYIAPEVLLGNYNEKCDVWSCGIILYVLLCGYPPFGGDEEEEILYKVKKGQYSFPSQDWNNISIEPKQLIQQMIEFNPSKRISAEQAFNDKWIQQNASNRELNQKNLQNLRTFQSKSKFKQAMITFMGIHMIGQQEGLELMKTFQALDKDGDGLLSREELIECYYEMLKDEDLAAIEVDKIMKQADIDNSGNVDYSEFLVAAINQEKLLTNQQIQQAFDLIDIDHNNFISKDELEGIMGEMQNEVQHIQFYYLVMVIIIKGM